MFRNGLIEETGALLRAGIEPQSKALHSLGYRQAVKVLEGDISLKDAIRECQTKTRQYAKRQLTWFRAEPDVLWLAGFGTIPRFSTERFPKPGDSLRSWAQNRNR